MLHEVHIENLAVIESLDIQFALGFTVLTGETGAGKSLLIQALDLVAGDRVSGEAIRQGADEATIEARLTLQSVDARRNLAEQGYGNDGDVVVRRLLRRDGQHRVYVNGRMATAGLLQDIVAPELEIHAQHSQQRLLSGDVQRQLLDRFAGLNAEVEAVAQAFDAWQAQLAEIEALTAKAGNRDQELDYLRFQLEEFDRLDPKLDELSELEARIRSLAGGVERQAAVATAAELLNDGEHAALDRIYSAAEALTRAAKHDDALCDLAARLDDVAGQLQQVFRDLPKVGGADEDIDLEALQTRKQKIERLTRKHGGDLAAALAEHDRMRQLAADLEALDERLATLQAEAQACEAAFRQQADRLSRQRQKAAESLAKAVTASLRQLEMPHATFAVLGWGDGKPRRHGIDDIQFCLAANPGDPPRPLRRVASGGELSRILLATQTEIGLEHAGATVVFDEADAGIGGETALTVGRIMRRLGERYQVLVVTHTPQVAAFAHQQAHLEKTVVAKRARTVARALEGESRVRELAGMLGVRDTATAIEHAKTLLAGAV